MATSYKALKEEFVSGLTGGSILEINYVLEVAQVALVLWSVLQQRQSFFTPYTWIACAVDGLLNIGCVLLSITLYSSNPGLLHALLIAPIVLVFALPRDATSKPRTRPAPRATKAAATTSFNALPVRPFLTAYRGCMMIITCLAILAVDFRIFPRRFAKVESWGTSIMDIGVGSFVFSAGVVAARPIIKEQAAGGAKSLLVRLTTAGRHALPLFVLGLVRFYSVKGLDYAEHVTEYGVHWNFFFTLAFIPPFMAVFEYAFQFLPSFAALAAFVTVTYELALELTDLKAFMLTAARVDLLSQNREGIFSLCGYLAIFLAGQSIGMLVLPRRLDSKGDAAAQRNILLSRLVAWSGGYVLLFFLATDYRWGMGLTVSRRLANLPYVLWIAAFNCAQLSIFCAVETFFFPGVYKAVDQKAEDESSRHATSTVLGAFNRNGLAIFLVANLLTGLVNLTVPTLDVGNGQAMSILVAYATVLAVFALALDRYGINIKL